MRAPTRAAAAVCFLTAAVLAGSGAAAQSAPPRIGRDTVVATADTSFHAGAFHRILFGRHYRNIWHTPVRVAVLDLAHFDGGLTPTQKGGGEQTKSLRFRAASGRTWVFRTVRKDARVILPKAMRHSFVADLVNDQISHSNPAGALTVPPMLDALGVLHVTPQFAMMPDDARLGEFRKAFGGQMGLLEEFPDDGPDGAPGFAGSTKIGNSLSLLAKISHDPDDQVDARGFLTARLFDLVINDWDRHKDQWKWARYDRGDGHIWLPIPRDRDQAYIWFDGLFPWAARLGAPKLIPFSRKYPNLNGLTLNGRELDRALLNGLSRAVWDSVSRSVRERLTDAVVDTAVGRMPPEMRSLTGARIDTVVKYRRDHLDAEASRYYALLAKVVDIHATDARELALVDRDSAGGLRVRLVDARRKQPGALEDRAPYYDRYFLPNETEEVRLYLHGGGDSAIVRGRSERGVQLRLIGGEGDNTLVDSSVVAFDRGATHIYDNGSGPRDITYGPDTLFNRRPEIVSHGDTTIAPPDFGGRAAPGLRLRYLADLGFVFGAGITMRHYAFRTWPYWYETSLWIERGTGPNDTRAALHGDFRREGHSEHLILRAQASGLELIRYAGQGNETARAGNGDYNRLEHTEYRFEAMLTYPVAGGELRLGPVLQFSRTGADPGTLAGGTHPYGSGDFGQFGARASFTLDTRNDAAAPRRGVRLGLGGSVYPRIWDIRSTFGEVHGEASTYIGIDLPLQPVLALRAGGKKVWGDFPFYESAFLGGYNNLRGFDQQRFAGDASAWGNAELRIRLVTLRFLLPVTLGIHGLADAGRVWAAGETSNRWHHAFGAGIWADILGPASTISATLAHSDERNALYVLAGFGF